MSSAEEVKSLSNQAEKMLDRIAAPAGSWEETVNVARILAELAKAHAMVELADAIRESTFGADVVAPGLRPI